MNHLFRGPCPKTFWRARILNNPDIFSLKMGSCFRPAPAYPARYVAAEIRVGHRATQQLKLRIHMANSQERSPQISVPLDADLRDAIQRRAAAEHRTVASFVRHVVAKALESPSEHRAAA